MSKYTLTLNTCPRLNSVLSQVEIDVSSVREKTGHASWDQHFYFTSLWLFILLLVSQCSVSHCFISVSECSPLITNVNPLHGVTVKNLDRGTEAQGIQGHRDKTEKGVNELASRAVNEEFTGLGIVERGEDCEQNQHAKFQVLSEY